MNLSTLREFFMWCSIINGGLLLFTAMLSGLAANWMYRAHRTQFPMSEEAFTVEVYGWIGRYKLLFIVFNLVPYLALSIMD